MTLFITNKKTKRITSPLDEKILFFGLEDFIDTIVKSESCFVCGALPTSKAFNNEHIIPKWILDKFGLQSQRVTLPNDTSFRYNQYKVPCCRDCNSFLGDTYEKPISKLLTKPYEAIVKDIQDDRKLLRLLYTWMCLIFFKTHLKDNSLVLDQSSNVKQDMIGSIYDWADFHHIHCMARSLHTQAKIDKEVYGSLIILPSLSLNSNDVFDYIDNPLGAVNMIKLGHVSIIAALDDASACYSIYHESLDKINGPISTLQLREVVAHFSFININLATRPVFSSGIVDGNYRIRVKLPDRLYLSDEKDWIATPGEFLAYHARRHFGVKDELILKELEEGKRNYLFDEQGNFINYENMS